MSDGRTVWWPKDSAWWRREHVVELGEEFGADGPAVLDWLSCEAKVQNDGGRVTAGPRSVARGCFVSTVTVGHVLSRAVQLGALLDFEETDGRFSCVIRDLQADHERGRAAVRQAAKRARDREETLAEQGDSHEGLRVTEGDTSRPVTQRHARSQKVTLKEEKRRENNSPPSPPNGGRGRDRRSWEREMAGWVEAHPATIELVAAWEPIKARLAEMVDEPTMAMWLDELHLHYAGDEMILGAPAKKTGWIESRYLRPLTEAAGCPVRIIACGCTPAIERAA